MTTATTKTSFYNARQWEIPAFLDGSRTMISVPMRKQPVGAWAAPGKTAAPLGSPGDVVGVREPWRRGPDRRAESRMMLTTIEYRADDAWDATGLVSHLPIGGRWLTSLPPIPLRIHLTIKEVRVCKLHDIGYHMALKHGLHEDSAGWHFKHPAPTLGHIEARQAWEAYWNLRYPKHPYDSNPWIFNYTVQKERV